MGTTAAITETTDPTLYREQAIEQLTTIFASHQPFLTRMAGRLLGATADAEDAVQDGFLSAYTHVDQFRGQARMSTWVTTIVINAARMRLRARPAQTHIPLDQKNPEQDHASLVEMLPDGRPSPEESCRSAELAEHLARACSHLSPTLRSVFHLSEVCGLSIHETAESLRITHSAAKSRLARARKRLKAMLRTQMDYRRDANWGARKRAIVPTFAKRPAVIDLMANAPWVPFSKDSNPATKFPDRSAGPARDKREADLNG